MNMNTVFFKATDGVSLNGILYKSEKQTKKVLISIHGMVTNCLKPRDEIIAKKVKTTFFIIYFNKFQKIR